MLAALLACGCQPPVAGIDAGTTDASLDARSEDASDAARTRRDTGPLTLPDAAIDSMSSPCGDCSALAGPCTVVTCDEFRAVCVPHTLTTGTLCDDQNPCTTSDVCTAVGTCLGAPSMLGLTCDDQSPCTHDDTCNGVGTCVGTTNDCTAMDSTCSVGTCDPTSGACHARPVADCSPCAGDPTHVCMGAVCGAAPTVLAWSFDTGLPVGWTTTGGSGWAADATTAHLGGTSLGTGPLGDSTTTTLAFSVNTMRATSLDFWYRTSTERGWDFFRVYVDASRVLEVSGEIDWTELTSPLSPGPHTVRFEYHKDGNASAGADRVWIDDVRMAPSGPSGAVVTGPIVESFEGPGLPAGSVSGGDAPWMIDPTDATDGLASAQSGDIGDSPMAGIFQLSSLSLDVTIPPSGGFSVMARTSTERTFDYLEVLVDGLRVSPRDQAFESMTPTYTGETPWHLIAFAAPEGAHTLTFQFSKDYSVSMGADAVWIDELRVGTASVTTNACR